LSKSESRIAVGNFLSTKEKEPKMFKLAQLAFRNVFRNKRRTIITEISIVIGLVAIIFAGGLLRDMEIGWRDALIFSDTGHIQIIAEGLKDDSNIKNSIKDSREITGKLKKYPNIKGYTERIELNGLVSNGEDTQMFIGRGIDPNTQLNALPEAAGKITSGRYLEYSDLNGAVIGEGLADKLHVKLNDTLTLATNDKYESFNAVIVTIIGIATIDEGFDNDHFLALHIDNARTLVSYDPFETSKIVLTIDKTEDTLNFSKIISSEFQPHDQVEVFSWHELAGMFNEVVAIFTSINAILIIILLILTLVGIMNTILMSVFERTKEIGTLMAIGSAPRQVHTIFILESLFIGIIGVIIGVILGLLINLSVISLGGLHLPPPPGQISGISLSPIILPGKILSVSLLVLITSILGALYPAKHAAKQRPVDALRTN
jgi:putative ABC transport system permease protein